MARKHITTKARRAVRQQPFREDRFAWKPQDVHITYPDVVVGAGELDSELHTILWSLEHVPNRAAFDEVMVNVAAYLVHNPGDKLVAAAVRRVELRLEHAT